MTMSRRRLLGAGVGLMGIGLAPSGGTRAQTHRFDSDPFTLGVASGYPEPRAVVLWTRLAPAPLTPGGGMPAAPVPVDWEIAEDSRFRRVRASGVAYAIPDWAHSVHVEATGLEPGRDYWYRFTSAGAESPIGRTRTAPADGETLARLRLGVACCQHYENAHYAAFRGMAEDRPDLILHLGDYIYENRGISRVRTLAASEAYTLEDYRQRYAVYKSDPSLKAAHAAAPWIVTWDDHEVDNDYADWHSLEDDIAEIFLARRAAAYQAYYEHLPLPRRLIPFGPHLRLHTRRSFGDLVDIHVLDGRQYRSDQACDNGLVSPCAELFERERTMLGRAQEAWLERGLGASRARFNLLAQQTVFAHMDQRPGPETGYWSDGWSGYPAARRRLIEQLTARETPNPVILSGDIHAFLVNDVHADPGHPESPVVAAELVTSSISSAGPPQELLASWARENPNVRLARSDHRGYLRLEVTRDGLHADLVAVDDASLADSSLHVLAAFDVENGRAGVAT